MTCKHLNVNITEEYLVETDIIVVDGVTEIIGDGDPTIKFINIICSDCGMSKRYSFERIPKWLKNYLK